MSSTDNHNDLDRLEAVIRKKPVSANKPQTKIPLDHPDKYPQMWFDTQEELDAYDSLMRKKVYYQNSYGDNLEKEFVQNGTKTTFGIFTKEFRERRYEMSNLMKNQLEYLEGLESNKEYQDLTTKRYHTWSDFNYMKEHYIFYFKAFLLYGILRELPIKNFYARCFVMGFGLWYANYHWWNNFRPLRYANERDQRELNNYPLLKELVTKKVDTKSSSPTVRESVRWWGHQSPVFYHHHTKHYRYFWRTKREVQWDGTFNMPIYPFHNLCDRMGFVHAGLLESVEPKANGAW